MAIANQTNPVVLDFPKTPQGAFNGTVTVRSSETGQPIPLYLNCESGDSTNVPNPMRISAQGDVDFCCWYEQDIYFEYRDINNVHVSTIRRNGEYGRGSNGGGGCNGGGIITSGTTTWRTWAYPEDYIWYGNAEVSYTTGYDNNEGSLNQFRLFYNVVSDCVHLHNRSTVVIDGVTYRPEQLSVTPSNWEDYLREGDRVVFGDGSVGTISFKSHYRTVRNVETNEYEEATDYVDNPPYFSLDTSSVPINKSATETWRRFLHVVNPVVPFPTEIGTQFNWDGEVVRGDTTVYYLASANVRSGAIFISNAGTMVRYIEKNEQDYYVFTVLMSGVGLGNSSLKPMGTISTNPPSNPDNNDLWINSSDGGSPNDDVTGTLWQWIGGQWVRITIFPNPHNGDLWHNVNDNSLWFWLNGDYQPLNFNLNIENYFTKNEVLDYLDGKVNTRVVSLIDYAPLQQPVGFITEIPLSVMTSGARTGDLVYDPIDSKIGVIRTVHDSRAVVQTVYIPPPPSSSSSTMPGHLQLPAPGGGSGSGTINQGGIYKSNSTFLSTTPGNETGSVTSGGSIPVGNLIIDAAGTLGVVVALDTSTNQPYKTIKTLASFTENQTILVPGKSIGTIHVGGTNPNTDSDYYTGAARNVSGTTGYVVDFYWIKGKEVLYCTGTTSSIILIINEIPQNPLSINYFIGVNGFGNCQIYVRGTSGNPLAAGSFDGNNFLRLVFLFNDLRFTPQGSGGRATWTN